MRVIILALMLAGCSSGKEKSAIEMFMKSCAAPVEAKMTLTQWGNSLELGCADVRVDKK